MFVERFHTAHIQYMLHKYICLMEYNLRTEHKTQTTKFIFSHSCGNKFY